MQVASRRLAVQGVARRAARRHLRLQRVCRVVVLLHAGTCRRMVVVVLLLLLLGREGVHARAAVHALQHALRHITRQISTSIPVQTPRMMACEP